MKKIPDIQHYIRDFVDESANNLSPYVAQGRLNNEFICGRQNRKINPRTLDLEDKKPDPNLYTEKKIYNRLLPIYLTRYGLLTKNMPIPGIEPNNNTTKAVNDSLKANKFFLSYITDTNFKDKYCDAIKKAEVYGIVWWKTGIDWTDGDIVCEVEAEAGVGKGKMVVREGRPFISPVPINEVFTDNIHAESMDDINELVHRRVFPVEYIQKRWGFDAKKEDVVETKLQTYPKYSAFGFAEAGRIEYAYVYEYYKKPDAIYPNGRYVIMCNDKIIWDGILPYENAIDKKRVIPFDFMTLQSIPNFLVGVTVYSQLIPIQETYNSIKNRYLEYVNHIAIGQLYYWEGSLINKNNFTTKPGKLIGLKRNARKPEPVQKDKLSNEFMQYLQSLENDMLVTSGLSEMTAFGASKSNVRTDGVVDKLTESDDNKLVNALDNISACIINLFKKLVYLEKQRHETLYEKLKVYKADSYAKDFCLCDVDAEQVAIVNRDFLMQSDQVFDKKLQQAGNLGLYAADSVMSYHSKVEFLNAIHASYLKDTLDPIERATHDLCDNEHRLVVEHKLPECEAFHKHQQHIQEHELFLISPFLLNMKETDPEGYAKVKQALVNHLDQHKKMLGEQQQGDPYANAKALMSTGGRQPKA